ncbi:MAG: Fic family protein [Rhodoferax sp.]|nr:Fic family protein [Rhodoferax sp.]MDP3653513.1 Fic family protein [Rhodoferax sp.]
MTPDERLSEQKSFARVKELIEKPVNGPFDAAHLQEIHRRIFQDSPQHRPGQFRTFTPAYIKMRCLESTGHRYRVTYAPAQEMQTQLDQVLGALADAESWRGLNVEDFSRHMANLYGDLDYLHPFIEGNSRSLRVFTAQWACTVGYQLHWGTASADAATRDRLYVARDLEVTARAFPGLDFERASTTPNRAECDAWLSFASKYQHHESLAALIQRFVQGV